MVSRICFRKQYDLPTVSPSAQKVYYTVVGDNTPTAKCHSGMNHQAKMLNCEAIEAFGKKDGLADPNAVLLDTCL